MRNNKTGLLNYRDLRTRLNKFLVPLSPVQHVTVASATYFFLFTIASDVISCFLAPLCSTLGIVTYPIGFVPILVGVVLPCYGLLWIYADTQEGKNHLQKRPSNAPAVVVRALKYIGVLILLTFLVAAFIFAEMIFPVSAIPLMTTLGALLLIHLGKGTVQHIPVGRRRALVAAFVLLVLSVEYMDLNSRKPFARHMFQVHIGMTGADVERIMSGHMKNWVEPESEHYLHLDPHFTGEAWYRHTTEWWGNADWGKVGFKDGRVVSAEICLCD